MSFLAGYYCHKHTIYNFVTFSVDIFFRSIHNFQFKCYTTIVSIYECIKKVGFFLLLLSNLNPVKTCGQHYVRLFVLATKTLNMKKVLNFAQGSTTSKNLVCVTEV